MLGEKRLNNFKDWVEQHNQLFICIKQGETPNSNVDFYEDQLSIRSKKISIEFPMIFVNGQLEARNSRELPRTQPPQVVNLTVSSTSEQEIEVTEGSEVSLEVMEISQSSEITLEMEPSMELESNMEIESQTNEEQDKDEEYLPPKKFRRTTSGLGRLRSNRTIMCDASTMTEFATLPPIPLRDGRTVNKACLNALVNVCVRGGNSIERARKSFAESCAFLGQNYLLDAENLG